MLLTQSGFYALQAALRLAREPDALVSARVIAGELAIPANYLGKVLQRLGREGIVHGTRGPTGGYRLTSSPAETTVADIVGPFEGLRPPETCLLGGPCDPVRPCSAHRRRAEWSHAYEALLRQTTLADLLHTNGDHPTASPAGHSSRERLS